MSDIKQVIVVRKDLNMRKGKIVAQAAHASMKIFFDVMWPNFKGGEFKMHSLSAAEITMPQIASWTIPNLPYFEKWIQGSFKKVCVYVDSLDELIDIERSAIEKGIYTAMIIDEGLTEFKGQHTHTCLALGPWDSEQLDEITGKLKLL